MRLDANHRARIRRLMRDRMPDQWKLALCLVDILCRTGVIEAEYGIALPTRTVGLYLARWGYTPARWTTRRGPTNSARNPHSVGWISNSPDRRPAQGKAERGEFADARRLGCAGLCHLSLVL